MISPTLVDKAGLPLIGRLTKLSQIEARFELGRLGGFDPSEVDALVLLCKNTQAPAKITYFAQRRKAIIALWLLGVSWQQIANLFQVSKPTIVQSAHRAGGSTLPPRLAERCTHIRAAEYNAAFWQNVTVLAEQDPPAIAAWLLSNTEVDE